MNRRTQIDLIISTILIGLLQLGGPPYTRSPKLYYIYFKIKVKKVYTGGPQLITMSHNFLKAEKLVYKYINICSSTRVNATKQAFSGIWVDLYTRSRTEVLEFTYSLSSYHHKLIISPIMGNSLTVLPIETIFKLPSQVPSWPPGIY